MHLSPLASPSKQLGRALVDTCQQRLSQSERIEPVHHMLEHAMQASTQSSITKPFTRSRTVLSADTATHLANTRASDENTQLKVCMAKFMRYPSCAVGLAGSTWEVARACHKWDSGWACVDGSTFVCRTHNFIYRYFFDCVPCCNSDCVPMPKAGQTSSGRSGGVL